MPIFTYSVVCVFLCSWFCVKVHIMVITMRIQNCCITIYYLSSLTSHINVCLCVFSLSVLNMHMHFLCQQIFIINSFTLRINHCSAYRKLAGGTSENCFLKRTFNVLYVDGPLEYKLQQRIWPENVSNSRVCVILINVKADICSVLDGHIKIYGRNLVSRKGKGRKASVH